MQDFRVYSDNLLYGFHGLRSECSLFKVGNTEHNIFECLEYISDFSLNINKSKYISCILYINHVAPCYPRFFPWFLSLCLSCNGFIL